MKTELPGSRTLSGPEESVEMRHQERGMSMWPFVIALVLLLVFVFLWYDQKSEVEKKTADVERLVTEKATVTTQLSQAETYLDDVSKAVGFATTGNADKTRFWTNVTELSNALNPEKDGSAVAQFKKDSTVPIRRDLYKAKTGAPAPTTLDLSKVSQAFKDKVAEVKAAFPGLLPPRPDDEDNAQEMAKYAADLKEYNDKFEKYQKLLGELVLMKEFDAYKAIIGVGSMYELEKAGDVVQWAFWEKPATAVMTVEDYLKVPPVVVKSMRDALADRINSLLVEIDGVKKTNEELKKALDNADPASEGLKQQLEKVQAQLAADTAKLQGEAAAARAQVEQLRVEATTANQALAQEKENHKRDTSVLETAVKARDNRIREDKEKKDLEILRDDPDGVILGADNNIGVAYINLGSSDKVYPGLAFTVSTMRGGTRTPKGNVMVSRVIDAHYSQVRILGLVDRERPITKDDLIANPFFNAKRPVHLFLAGELKKYPKTIAIERLKTMGVVIDDQINDKTDFVLIPSGMSAPTSGAAPAPAEGGAAPAPTESEYDKLVRIARSFGATLITERLLESFLQY